MLISDFNCESFLAFLSSYDNSQTKKKKVIVISTKQRMMYISENLKELRHDPRMCEIWLRSHKDSSASAILNLSELLNLVMDKTLTPSPWTTLMDYPNGLP